MRLRTCSRRSRRQGRSQLCRPGGAVGTSLACSSRHIVRPGGICRRGQWRTGRRLRFRSWHQPPLRPPASGPGTGRGAELRRHGSAPRSRCCSCAHHSRRPAPTPWCTPWVVSRTRLGRRLRRSTAPQCIDKTFPARRMQSRLRIHSCRPARREHRPPPSQDTLRIGAAKLHVSELRRY